MLVIWRSSSPNSKFLGIGDYHYPLLRCRVPDYLRISKLGTVNRDDGVIGIFGERVASVGRVSNLMPLSIRRTLTFGVSRTTNLLSLFLCGIERVESNYTTGLIREEAASIVHINH